MAQGSRDPFGGTVRRTIIVPGQENLSEKTQTFKEKREELKEAVLDNADRAALEFDMARIRNETGKLQLEYQEIQRKLGVPEAQVTATAIPAFGGTTAVLLDILQLGQKTGIDVTSLIRQVLTGQGTLVPPAPVQSTEGIPNPLMQAFSHIIEKSFENNTKPREDGKMLVLEERLKNQEDKINSSLSEIKETLKQRTGEVKDPTQAAADNVKNLTLLITAVKALSPEPAAPITGNSAELAFKYQDRQWGHEEAKLNADVERQKITANMEIEQRKLEQGRDNLAQIPQMIGAVVAQSLIESGKGKGGVAASAAAPKQRITLKVSKSKSLPHDAITIKCPVKECQQDVSFVTSAKTANCVNCGTAFDIQLVETEGGPIGVETGDQQKPAPHEEPPPLAPSDAYFTRGM